MKPNENINIEAEDNVEVAKPGIFARMKNYIRSWFPKAAEQDEADLVVVGEKPAKKAGWMGMIFKGLLGLVAAAGALFAAKVIYSKIKAPKEAAKAENAPNGEAAQNPGFVAAVLNVFARGEKANPADAAFNALSEAEQKQRLDALQSAAYIEARNGSALRDVSNLSTLEKEAYAAGRELKHVGRGENAVSAKLRVVG